MRWLRLRLQSIVRYACNYLVWFRRGWPLWLILGTFVFLFVAPSYSVDLGPTTEVRIRITGMAFQILGFFVALYGANDALKNLGLRSIPSRVFEYFREIPIFQRQNGTVVDFSGTAVARLTARGFATTSIRTDATADEKIAFLQTQVSAMQKSIHDEIVNREKAVEDLRKAIQEQCDGILRELTELKKASMDKVEGDARLEAYGVLLFLVGVVLSTASKEIQGLL